MCTIGREGKKKSNLLMNHGSIHLFKPLLSMVYAGQTQETEDNAVMSEIYFRKDMRTRPLTSSKRKTETEAIEEKKKDEAKMGEIVQFLCWLHSAPEQLSQRIKGIRAWTPFLLNDFDIVIFFFVLCHIGRLRVLRLFGIAKFQQVYIRVRECCRRRSNIRRHLA